MRVLRTLLITVVVLGVLFVVVDRVAVWVAESEAASRVKGAQGFSADPDISIEGFPFLTQVAAGKLERVRATAEDVRAGSGGATLRISRFDADLRDVRITDNYRSAVADRASGRALVTYQDLSEAAPPGTSVSYGGKNAETGADEVKVTFRVKFLNQTFDRSVRSTVTLKGDTLRIRATSVPDVGLPGFEEFLRDQIDFSTRITGLPKGIELQRLSLDREGATTTLTGSNVPLTG